MWIMQIFFLASAAARAVQKNLTRPWFSSARTYGNEKKFKGNRELRATNIYSVSTHERNFGFNVFFSHFFLLLCSTELKFFILNKSHFVCVNNDPSDRDIHYILFNVNIWSTWKTLFFLFLNVLHSKS